MNSSETASALRNIEGATQCIERRVADLKSTVTDAIRDNWPLADCEKSLIHNRCNSIRGLLAIIEKHLPNA